jgi:hypothetical protein
MNQIFIPYSRLDKLKAKIESMNRKANRLNIPCHAILTLHDESFETFHIEVDKFTQPKKITVQGIYVSVDGLLPVIDNWRVIAKIEHLEQGNFIKSFSEIPKIYRDSKAACDHCNQNRKRIYTIILQNIESGEFKQVGRSCLADYLRNNKADSILHWYSYLDLNDYSEPIESGYYSDSILVNSALNITLHIIENHGYLSKTKARELNLISTSDRVIDFITDNKSAKHNQHVDVIISKLTDYFNAAKNLSDYEYNLSLIIENEYIPKRFLGYLTSIPKFYDNLLERELKEQESAKSEFIGKIKERRDFKLHVNFIRPIDGYYGTSYLCKFTDKSGNKFTWFSSRNPDFNENDDILLKGTIKEHTIYQNEKQTKLTRCKLMKGK